MASQVTSTQKGFIAESKAISFLESNKFEIKTRNYRVKGGEIDIIAFRDNVLHFVEVKSGVNFDPVYAITNKKLNHIKLAINTYLKQYKIDSAYCISAIIIRGEQIEFLENITL